MRLLDKWGLRGSRTRYFFRPIFGPSSIEKSSGRGAEHLERQASHPFLVVLLMPYSYPYVFHVIAKEDEMKDRRRRRGKKQRRSYNYLKPKQNNNLETVFISMCKCFHFLT